MEKLAQQINEKIKFQTVKQIGGLPLIKQKLDILKVKQTINRYCPCECDIDIGSLVEIMVLNRLTSPVGLYKVADWASNTMIPETYQISIKKLTDDRLADALDRIYPYLENIWVDIAVEGIKLCKDEIGELLYDLTSVYFTGVYEDAEDLALGYSRDEKPGTLQLELGINVTSKSGILIYYKQLKGNTADITTPKDNLKGLEKIISKSGIKYSLEPLIITDRGMIDGERMRDYHDSGFHYLSMYRTTNDTKKIAVEQLDNLNNSPLNRVDKYNGKYFGVKVPLKLLVKDSSDDKINPKAKKEELYTTLFVYKSETKEKGDRESRNKTINKELNALKELDSKLNCRNNKKKEVVEKKIKEILKSGKYYDTDVKGEDGSLTLTYQLNEEKINEDSQHDGIFYAVTDLEKMTPLQGLEKLKSRDKVEKKIETLKGPLEVRPIFLHKEKRISSLILMVMIALLIYTLIEKEAREKRLRVTTSSILLALMTLSVIVIKFVDGSISYKVANPSSEQRKILQRFGVYSLREYEELTSGFI